VTKKRRAQHRRRRINESGEAESRARRKERPERDVLYQGARGGDVRTQMCRRATGLKGASAKYGVPVTGFVTKPGSPVRCLHSHALYLLVPRTLSTLFAAAHTRRDQTLPGPLLDQPTEMPNSRRISRGDALRLAGRRREYGAGAREAPNSRSDGARLSGSFSSLFFFSLFFSRLVSSRRSQARKHIQEWLWVPQVCGHAYVTFPPLPPGPDPRLHRSP
jgi:hypothetical protein